MYIVHLESGIKESILKIPIKYFSIKKIDISKLKVFGYKVFFFFFFNFFFNLYKNGNFLKFLKKKKSFLLRIFFLKILWLSCSQHYFKIINYHL